MKLIIKKNENSSLSVAVRNIRVEFRPDHRNTMQNNLRELWALNFLMPDIFGDGAVDAVVQYVRRNWQRRMCQEAHSPTAFMRVSRRMLPNHFAAQEGDQTLHWSHPDAARGVCSLSTSPRAEQVGWTDKHRL
jgi:hypothetical protein